MMLRLSWSHLSWSHLSCDLISHDLISLDLTSRDLISYDLISHDLVSHLIPFVSLLILHLFLTCRWGLVHQSVWYHWTARGARRRNLLTRAPRRRYNAWKKIVIVTGLLILLPDERQLWEWIVDGWINDGLSDILGCFAFDGWICPIYGGLNNQVRGVTHPPPPYPSFPQHIVNEILSLCLR